MSAASKVLMPWQETGGPIPSVGARSAWLWVAGAALLGCQSPQPLPPAVKSYLATERTIDVGVGPRLCVAVDLSDPAGVWWWQPGSSGCGSRSTGPGLFHPEGATVRPSAQNGVHEIVFTVGTHSATRPFVDVRLLVDRGTLKVAGSTESVPLVPRSHLEIPEKAGRGGAG
jgi:hypothetical protein